VRSHWDGAFDRLIVLEEPRAGAVPATRIRSQLEGFISIVGAVPEGKCIRLNSGNTREVSERAILTSLKHFPDQHKIAVISFNDDAAIGALEAARKLDREEDIAIVGQGAERRVRQELTRQGSRIIGSTTYSPEGYGEHIIPLALRLINCEPVPPAVYMQHRFIDAENPT
jgi:ribose transport system substrate-binding protein